VRGVCRVAYRLLEIQTLLTQRVAQAFKTAAGIAFLPGFGNSEPFDGHRITFMGRDGRLSISGECSRMLSKNMMAHQHTCIADAFGALLAEQGVESCSLPADVTECWQNTNW